MTCSNCLTHTHRILYLEYTKITLSSYFSGGDIREKCNFVLCHKSTATDTLRSCIQGIILDDDNHS